jgi:CHAT domain-containing protein/Tfp pilus assembly protein PilF
MKIFTLLLVSILTQTLVIQLPSYPITPIAQVSPEQKEQVNELISAGRKSLRTGNYKSALDEFQQGLLLAKKSGYRGAEVDALLGIGTVYNAVGQYPKALEYFQQSLKLSQEIGDREGEGIIANNIGTVYIYLGQYPKALEYFQQALTIKKALGDNVGQEATLINIGAVYNEIGQYSKALEYYQPALSMSRSRGNKAREEAVLNNIATVYKNLGQYPKALEYYQQSLTIKREIGNKAGEGTTLNNIGAVYDSLGQYLKALEYYQQSLVIAQTISDRAGEKNTLNNIAAVYQSLEQYPKALQYFQQSLKIVQSIGDRSGEGTIFNNIGTVYQYLGQYSTSLDYLQKSLTIRKAIGDQAGEGNSIGNIGEVYRSLRQYPKALAYLQQSLTIRRMIGDRDGEGGTLNNIGATFLDQKKPALAEKSLRAAIAIWENIRGSKNNRGEGLSDRDKVAFADRVSSTYKLLQRALIEQNKPQAALEISERARARGLAELLASKISKTNAASSQAIRQAPSLSKIQQIAKTKQATLVQYSIIDDNLIYIWAIKPTGEIVFQQSKLPAKTKLKDLIVATRQNIGAESRSPEQENLPEPEGDLQQLYKILIEPIAKELPTNPEAEVVILPQKELFLVPFAALQDAQEKYLIEKHTLTIAPSIQVLGLSNKKSTSSSGKPVVVGNPIMPTDYKNQAGEPEALANLPGSEAEAKTVAEILKVTPLIGQAADKQQVVKLLKDSPIVHLATHGLLRTLKGDIPGAIVLTNGFLTSSEIFDMQLQADLVVLSACDTGRGDLTGDGVVGLSRSLAVAGVPSVIVSLWEVSDDATMSLMSEFYRNLRVKKLAKSQALRQAMLTTMQLYPKPTLWSAFMLVGEGN